MNTRRTFSLIAGSPASTTVSGRVSDGTRTRDRLDHNQELYLLSYAHHVAGRLGRSAFGI